MAGEFCWVSEEVLLKSNLETGTITVLAVISQTNLGGPRNLRGFSEQPELSLTILRTLLNLDMVIEKISRTSQSDN
jgi:hypothetical protein